MGYFQFFFQFQKFKSRLYTEFFEERKKNLFFSKFSQNENFIHQRNHFTESRAFKSAPGKRLKMSFKYPGVCTWFVGFIMTQYYLRTKDEPWMKKWVGDADYMKTFSD